MQIPDLNFLKYIYIQYVKLFCWKYQHNWIYKENVV